MNVHPPHSPTSTKSELSALVSALIEADDLIERVGLKAEREVTDRKKLPREVFSFPDFEDGR